MSKLVLDKVSYQYKNSKSFAVKEISCTFEPGILYAVTGPSGSGKSTLLSLLSGLDRPVSGDITLDGENLKKMDLDQYRRQKVAVIFQNFQLLPLLTVAENVSYVMEINGMKKKDAMAKAAQILESVGISKEKHRRYPSHLSGGEQQRVAISRALASGARILLADEPTGNLDVANSQKIMEILKELAYKQQYCVIVVTHDMDIAKAADVTFKMRDGEFLDETA